MRISKSSFSPEELKSKILRGYCGDQLIPEVLFRLRGLGLLPNSQIRGRGHIRGRSVKEEMKIVLQDEVKGICSGLKHIRG